MTGDSDFPRTVAPGARVASSAEKRQKEKRRKPASNVSGIRRILYRGWEILVGANAAANDELTSKLARPDDLWLHAEGMPGSHVLVRNPMKTDVPPDILLKAAALAAMHSKGKTAGKVRGHVHFRPFCQETERGKTGTCSPVPAPDLDGQARRRRSRTLTGSQGLRTSWLATLLGRCTIAFSTLQLRHYPLYRDTGFE